MPKGEKKRGTGKLVALIASAVLVAILIAAWLIGWFAPISAATPLFLMMTRPEIRSVSGNLMIGNGGLYFVNPWLMEIIEPAWDADQLVYGMDELLSQAKAKETVYYPVYTDEETEEDAEKEKTGLYCLRPEGEEKHPFVLMIAGGGFTSVCTPMESLPVCASFCEMGYTCFALTYRVGDTFGEAMPEEEMMEDVSRAAEYILSRADEFNVEADNYLIGGFSAGAYIASTWCDETAGYGAYGLPAPAALCMMYGISEAHSESIDVPVYMRFCEDDPYFTQDVFDACAVSLKERGIAVNYETVSCLHGYGLGMGTEEEGWTAEAEAFWQQNLY